MNLEYGEKIIAEKPSGNIRVEIVRHPDPIMDNILIVNRIGRKKEYSWIIEKDLDTWIKHLKSEGFTNTKKVEDVGTSKKDNKKKK